MAALELQSLYEGRLTGLRGGSVVPAVHTAVTAVDGAQPDALAALQRIDGDAVAFQTRHVLLDGTLVNTTGGALTDIPCTVSDCVHAVNSTNRKLMVLHMRLHAAQSVDVRFNKSGTPPPDTEYYTITPRQRSKTFTITFNPALHSAALVYRLAFTDTNNSRLQSAERDGVSIKGGEMYPGVFVAGGAAPRVHVLGYDASDLTLRALQDLSVAVDSGTPTAYAAGDAVVLPQSYADLRVTEAARPHAALFSAHSRVDGHLRVIAASHARIDDVVEDPTITALDSVDTRGGVYVDVQCARGDAQEVVRVASDPDYGPCFAERSDGAVVSVLHAVVMEHATSTVDPDVVFTTHGVHVAPGLLVKCAWATELRSGQVVPDGVRRVRDVDVLSSMLHLPRESRRVRLVDNTRQAARIALNSSRFVFVARFHGTTQFDLLRSSGTVTRNRSSSPAAPRSDGTFGEIAALRVDGVPATDFVSYTEASSAVVRAADEMVTVTVRGPSSSQSALRADVVKDASATYGAVHGREAYDAIYVASPRPLVTDAVESTAYDTWSVDGNLLVWTRQSDVLRVDADTPCVAARLSSSLQYGLFGLLMHDTARQPSGTARVSSATRLSSTGTAFTVQCTSPKPVLVALNANTGGLATTRTFSRAMPATPAIHSATQDVLDAALTAVVGKAVNTTDAVVLPAGASAAFGFQRADSKPLTIVDVAAAATEGLDGQLLAVGPATVPRVALGEAYFSVPNAPEAPLSRVLVSENRTVVLAGVPLALSNVAHVCGTGFATEQDHLITRPDDASAVLGTVVSTALPSGVTVFTSASAARGALGTSWVVVPHAAAESMRSPDCMEIVTPFAGRGQMRVECSTPCVVTWNAPAVDVPFTYALPGVASGPATPIHVAAQRGMLFDTGTSFLDAYFVSLPDSVGQAVPPLRSAVPYYTTAREDDVDADVTQYVAPTPSRPLGLLPVVDGGRVHEWFAPHASHQPLTGAIGVASRNTSGETGFAPALYRRGGDAGAANGLVVRSGTREFVYVQTPAAPTRATQGNAWTARYSMQSVSRATRHMRLHPLDEVVVVDAACTALNATPVYQERGVAAVYRTARGGALDIAAAALPINPAQALFPVLALGDVSTAATLSAALSRGRVQPVHVEHDNLNRPWTRARLTMAQPGAAGAAGVFNTERPRLPSTLPTLTLLGARGDSNSTVFIAAPRTFDERFALTPASPHPGGSVLLSATGDPSALLQEHTVVQDDRGAPSAEWIVSPHADGTWAALPLRHAVSVLSCDAVHAKQGVKLGARVGTKTPFPLTLRDVDGGRVLGAAIMRAAELGYTVVDGDVRFEGTDAGQAAPDATAAAYVQLKNVLTPPAQHFTLETQRVPSAASVYTCAAALPDDVVVRDNPVTLSGPVVRAVALGGVCAAAVPAFVDSVEGGWGGVVTEQIAPASVGANSVDGDGAAAPLSAVYASDAQVAQSVMGLGVTPLLKRRLLIAEEWLAPTAPQWVVLERLLQRRGVASISTARELSWFLSTNVTAQTLTLGLVLTAFRIYRVQLTPELEQLSDRSRARPVLLTSPLRELI